MVAIRHRVLFCMNFNALFKGPDGLTPWRRRFGIAYEFRPYRFGALVVYTHPPESLLPGAKAKTD